MSTTHTEYAVARGNEIITDWTADRVFAEQLHFQIRDGMKLAALEPDVHLVESEVTVTVKRSRAKAVEDEQAQDPERGQPSDGSGVELPASGIWGDDSKPSKRKGPVTVKPPTTPAPVDPADQDPTPPAPIGEGGQPVESPTTGGDPA